MGIFFMTFLSETTHFDFISFFRRWRLYVVTCALPGLMSFIVLCFLPESPKFVLSQGKQVEAYQILQKMNRINNGKDAQLDEFEIREEKESIENRQRILEFQKDKFPLLSSIWNQTAPLFRPPHLKSSLLLCFIQLWVYYTCYGFYMLYADILNRMATNVEHPLLQRILVCDVINMIPPQYNSTNNIEEVSHFVKTSMIKFIFSVFWLMCGTQNSKICLVTV